MNETRTIGELQCKLVNRAAAGRPRGAVILCHGFGAPGTDLVSIADEVIGVVPELAELAYVFPFAPIKLDEYYDSRAWWMIDIERIQSLMMRGEFRELADSCPADLPARRKQLSNLVGRVENEYGLAAEKIVLGGFSQGAMLATDVVLNYPRKLGGLIVWSGSLINQSQWKAAAAKREPLRIVQSHGRLDPILPFAGAEALRQMLEDCGQKVEFVPFNGPHTINQTAIASSIELLKSLL
jgi:phospholipase/carboxylesterase